MKGFYSTLLFMNFLKKLYSFIDIYLNGHRTYSVTLIERNFEEGSDTPYFVKVQKFECNLYD